MRQFFENPNFDFLGKRYWAMALSGALILLGVGAITVKGLKYGIDFTGGTLVQVHAETDIAHVRAAIEKLFPDASPEVQNFGEASEYLIRLKTQIEHEQAFEKSLAEALGTEIRVDRVEAVGPRVGKELRSKAFWAVTISLILMLVYIWYRFNFVFGVGAVAALFHDVFITLGIFSLLGKEITIPIIAAFLTIVGYSINDSIVVSDRVREHLQRQRKKLPFPQYVDLLNRAVNETLSRTVITSGTTLFVLLALLFLGSPVTYNFSLALTIGVVVGTYSSIFIVVALVAEWERYKSSRRHAES